jgi:uncharacterized protein (UPF0261 family)
MVEHPNEIGRGTMTQKNILVMATLDTKGEAVELLCEYIRNRGQNPVILDLSTKKEPTIKPDISSIEVAIAGGGSEADTRGETVERLKRRDIMVSGAIKITKNLLEEGKIDGLIGLGGVSNAKMVSDVCQSLPFGLPKLILSSGAGMGSYNYIGRSDIALFESVGDTDSMNLFLRNSIARAAHMICGAAESGARIASVEIEEIRKAGSRVIALTHLSVDECVDNIMGILKKKGNYEVLSFQATGTGDMVMEDLIETGVNFDAVLDLCIAGLSEYLIGGNRAAAPTRLEAAGRRGIPQVITPTALDYISCGPLSRRDKGDPLWEKRKLKDRKLWAMDELRVLAKISSEEAVEIGKAVADKLNRAKGPVKFLVPLQGWNIPNREGGGLYQPEIDRLLIDTLKYEVDSKVVEIREYDLYMNSYEFAKVIVDTMEELLGTS